MTAIRVARGVAYSNETTDYYTSCAVVESFSHSLYSVCVHVRTITLLRGNECMIRELRPTVLQRKKIR